MADDKPKRKVRARGHVIADLGVNFVERQILLAGFTMQRITQDYGLDTFMTTFAPDGQVENDVVGIQVKATEWLSLTADGSAIPLRVESADLRYWLFELMPVVLVIYDATHDRAYWLDVQKYALEHDLDGDEVGETVTVRVPTTAELTVEAVKQFRDLKATTRMGQVDPDEE